MSKTDTVDTVDKTSADFEKKSGGKKRGKRSSSRGKGGISNRIAVNSPEFWNKVPGLLGAAGRIPSTNPMGINYHGFGSKLSNAANHNQLMVIPFLPSMGPAKGLVSDPVNTSAQQLYTFIRQQISGSRTYDAADLAQYIFAVYNLHAFLEMCKLVYGLTNVVSPVNRDIARIAIESIGYDYLDIVAHKADLLFYINNFSYKLTQFAIPGGMSMLSHWKLLLSGLFSDRYVDSLKNQFYLFVPKYFYIYDWANARVNVQTAYYRAPGNAVQFSVLTTEGNALINALVGNQDVGTMSGDILRAFEGRLEPVQPISAEYTATFNVTSNEMLNQIRNMIFYNPDDMSDFDIKQNGAYTLSYVASNGTPFVQIADSAYPFDGTANQITNFKDDFKLGYPLIGFEANMSEDAIMVATRMMATFTIIEPNADDYSIYGYLTSWGVECFFAPTFANINDGIITYTLWDAQVIVNPLKERTIEACRCEFEGCPRLTAYDAVHNTDPNRYSLSNGYEYYSLDNFLLIPFELLQDLNYTAVQSALYVPLAATTLAKK